MEDGGEHKYFHHTLNPMQYKVIATSYTKEHLLNTGAGWLKDGLVDLTNEINRLASKENWKVKQISTASADAKVIYTILLEKE